MTNKKLFILILASAIVGATAYFLFSGKKATLASYGYGFKNEKYLSRKIGEVQDFGLLDHQGVFHSLYRDSDAKAIVIISQGNDCPIIQKYALVINELKAKYGSKNVIFYLLNSARNDSRESIIAEAKKFNFDLPILMDPSQLVAESLGITRTSEAVIITPEDWKIVYRGAISDRMDYGVDKQVARNNYVEDVLDAVLANKEIKLGKASPAKGCLISFVEPKSISYEKVIAPILATKCVSCHSGVVGYLPYFDDHDKIKNWLAMSKETILTDRMPPWGADPKYGPFRADFSLTPDEKRTLVKWIDAGAPKDGDADPLVKVNTIFQQRKDAFSERKPLYTLKYTEKDIPPGGLIEYRYAQLGGPVPKDMWITGFNTTTDNPRQMHHETLMITSKPLDFYNEVIKRKVVVDEESRKYNVDGDITMYVLGTINKYEREKNPENYFRFMVLGRGIKQPSYFGTFGLMIFIPKGSYVILESHYMGTGKVESETSTFNLYGYESRPKDMKKLHSVYTTNSKFEIPANTKSFNVVTPVWKTDKNIHVISFNGHLHMRGSAIRTEMKPPKKDYETIMSLPNYFFGWQVGATYVLKEPIPVKAGTEFRTECNYNNSATNPYNPNPDKMIHFGQRVDRSEMCIMHIIYTIDNEKK